MCTEKLVKEELQTAKETNAGVIGPMYLEESTTTPHRIHMYGGLFKTNQFITPISPTNSPINYIDHHNMQWYNYTKYQNILIKRSVDYVEYHLLMVKTEILKVLYLYNKIYIS